MLTENKILLFKQMSLGQLNNSLFNSSLCGNLEEVKYLLTSPELKKYANIHADNNRALKEACSYGHLDIVKYLLTSPELKEHADIHAQNDDALGYACINGHLDIVKYLLTSPELKEHAIINKDYKHILVIVDRNNFTDILEYLIFDYKIEKTTHIEKYLIEKKMEHIIKMLDKRDLEEKLQLDLQYQDNYYNKTKNIKI